MKSLVLAVLALLLVPVISIGALAAAYAGSEDATPNAPRQAAGALGGPDTYVDDPTSSGRVTARMLNVYSQVDQAFDGWPWSIGCWDPHPWNPTSDHPLGRACDFAVGRLGEFPNATDRATGWRLARWLQANAVILGIRYVIWDGHIWSPARSAEGWRPYDGGGIYNPSSSTGGHHDHLHASVAGR